MHVLSIELSTGVEHDEPITGIDGIHRCDALQGQQSVFQFFGGRPSAAANLGLFKDRLYRMVGMDQVASTLPMLFRQLTNRCHAEKLPQLSPSNDLPRDRLATPRKGSGTEPSRAQSKPYQTPRSAQPKSAAPSNGIGVRKGTRARKGIGARNVYVWG